MVRYLVIYTAFSGKCLKFIKTSASPSYWEKLNCCAEKARFLHSGWLYDLFDGVVLCNREHYHWRRCAALWILPFHVTRILFLLVQGWLKSLVVDVSIFLSRANPTIWVLAIVAIELYVFGFPYYNPFLKSWECDWSSIGGACWEAHYWHARGWWFWGVGTLAKYTSLVMLDIFVICYCFWDWRRDLKSIYYGTVVSFIRYLQHCAGLSILAKYHLVVINVVLGYFLSRFRCWLRFWY